MKNDDAIVVMATFNEADNIGALIDGLRRHGLPVFVLDNNSPDGTAQIAAEHGASVEVRIKQGNIASAYLRALQCGLASGKRFVVQMDAGGTHSPSDVPVLLNAARMNGADLLIGGRFYPGVHWLSWRTLISRGAAFLMRIAGPQVWDATGGFRVWHRDTLIEALKRGAVSEGNAFQLELLWNAYKSGAVIGELPIAYKLTTSHFRWWMVKEALQVMWRILT